MAKPKLKYNVKQRGLLFIALGVVACVLLPLSSFAKKGLTAQADVKNESPFGEEEYSQNVKELMQFLEGRNEDYAYRRDGRSDPFMPFLRDKVVDQEVDATGAGELIGMQKFEPGQLLVVAIVQSMRGPVAMVQDSTGKGYLLTPGVKLGRSGVVDEITGNIILIKQQYLMTSGETRHRIVKMMLKHEGE